MAIQKVIIIVLFLLVLPVVYSIAIHPIYPRNNTVIYESSTWLNISTNEYGNCTYSLDSTSFTNFDSSTTGYWKVGTSTKKLDLSEELAVGGINRELIYNITSFIQKGDLKALDSGKAQTVKATSPYNQYLYLLGGSSIANMDSGYVVYSEDDDNDISADYLYFKSGRELGRYLLEFTTAFQSDIYNSSGNSSSTGLFLKDFENISIELLSKNYKIIKAKRISPNGKGIRLILANKTADALIKSTSLFKDTLLEKQTKSYTLNGKNYDVTLSFVDSDEAQFIFNSLVTGKLKTNWKQDLMDDLVIEVNDILYQDFAGGIHSATFSIIAEEISANPKLEIRDDNVEDYKSTNALKVNNNTIDNALVTIEGSDDGTTFKINRININMTADDNFFVRAGGKLSDAIVSSATLAEPQVLFTQNWDVIYKGLKSENTEKIKLKTSGTSQYNLQFVDGNGNTVEVPIAKSLGGSNLSFGEIDRDFVNVEAYNISKDDYLVITNGTAIRSSRPTYILQYKGADKISVDGHVIKFKNLGSGITIAVNYTNSTPLAYLNLSGVKNGIYLASSAGISQNDFTIQIDLDGDGILSNDTTSNTIITTRYGAEINITNQSTNSIQLSIRTSDDDRDNGKAIYTNETVVAIINITNGSGNITINTKEVIKIYTQGDNIYYLEFTDRDFNKVFLPIAENGTNNQIFFGQINKSLINKETEIIKKNYHFIMTDSSQDRGKRGAFALQYLGADRVTVDSPVLRFKNLGSGMTIQQIYSDNSPLAILKLGGQDFRVYKSPSADISIDDFDIQVDLDANGSLSLDNGYTVPITSYPKGVEINITNNTLPNIIQLTIRTFDTIINQTIKAKDNVDTLYPTLLRLNISASDGNVRHKIFSTVTYTCTPFVCDYVEPRLNFRVPSGQTNVEYAYTSYGTYIKRDFPSGQPATLDIDYPEKQREPLVYYENAGEHSKLLTNLNEGQHTIIINCTDIFEKLINYYLVFNFTILTNITSYSPIAGGINVSTKINIVVNFSKNMDKSTFKKSTFSVKELNGEKISGIFIYNDTINQTIFDPVNFLKFNTTYTINVTKNVKDLSGNSLDGNYVWNFTTAKKDTDNDGVSDDEDNDIDNDGINDSIDFLRGNLSNINSNFFNLSMKIDSEDNLTKIFNGTKKIEFHISGKKLLEFDYNFSSNSMLDLSNLSILNASNSSLGGVIIRGISLSRFSFKKTSYVEKIDNNKNGICIKDEEIEWIDNISDNCDGQNEYKAECDGSTQNGYTCTYNSSSNMYRVTGLSHSGVMQLSYTKPSSSGSGSSSGSSGGSSGGGSGGGGGGGGGAAGYICNMDWKCGEWNDCIDGLQTRQCDFVKVPQHWQEAPCPDLSKPPSKSQNCEVKAETPIIFSEKTAEAEAKEDKEEVKPKETNESESSQITGLAVEEIKKESNNLPVFISIASIVAAVLGIFLYYKLFRPKT